MHRLPQAAGLTAVIVSLLAALLAPAVVQARAPLERSPQPAVAGPWTAGAAELARTAPQAIKHATTATSCTGWRSDYQPPDTIRVLRTHGPDTGHVETVDFRTYVGWVLSAEWTNHYPLEALKVGAIAVKQYGWYYTIVYRGGVDAGGNCYDVTDNTNDQYYDPDSTPPRPGPIQIHLNAIAATWNVSLRKFSQAKGTSRLFVTGYRAGKNVPCGQETDGYRLYQHSIFRCASKLDPKHPTSPHDLTYEQILRIYLTNLEVVDPGAHDVIGSTQGDVTALTATGDATLAPRIYTLANLRGISPAGTSAIREATAGLIASRSIDMNGDGRDDLVTLTATSPTSARIDVALSNGATDYASPATWWPGTNLGEPVGEAQFLVGDFNADGRSDVGILVPAPDLPPNPVAPQGPQAQLIVVLQRQTGLPAPPRVWWTGSLNVDPAKSRVWAGDVNGDGATDLLVAVDASVPGTTPTGVHFAAALSSPPQVGLSALATWFDAPDLLLRRMRGVIGDINRDGRDDLFIAYPSAAGPTRIDVIKGNLRRVKRANLWTATAADPMPLAKLKLAVADLNFDGQSDLVLYRDRGVNGTTLLVLRGTYRKLKPYASFTDPTLVWATATPY